MDRTEVATDRMRDEECIDKKRPLLNVAVSQLESFRLGRGLPSSSSTSSSGRPSHSRSHSRNHSVSSSASLSISFSSNSMNDMSSFTPSTSSQSMGSSSQRPNSHHRRRSSVSTRRESAEMMGVSLPDLPSSNSDDNINLGDKDSIRRRALWALEGKTDSGAFSRVEIPELNTPEIERRLNDFPSKPSFPPGFGCGFGSGLSTIAGKRDSFGKHFVSSASKDQLHTLVEEEEEDEQEEDEQGFPPTPASTESPDDAVASHVPVPVITPSLPSARHRPVGLNLRPLSLTPETLISAVNGDLPTPSYTPSSRSSGLKSLTLSSSPSLSSPPSMNDFTIANVSTTAMRRQSLILPTITGPSSSFFRRSSFRTDSLSSISSVEGPEPPKRRSSIGYKPSFHTHVVAGLPTPDLTPTSDRRASSDSESDWSGHQPLSASEHQFLYQSHQALVARITDLERALTTRPPFRPAFSTSDMSNQNASSQITGSLEPNDEMLRLIVDLKAERDELKKDVDGWRVRVAGLEKQTGLLARRVDQERREAWVARERVGLLEVEKRAVAKIAEEKATLAEELQGEREALRIEFAKLQGDVERGKQVEEEVVRLKAELAKERSRREELERELESAGLLATPTPLSFSSSSAPAHFIRRRGLGLYSIDSMSSSTDVESVDSVPGKSSGELKAVLEEEEEDGQDSFSDEDNELAGYEDEDDSDISFASPGGSSLGSVHEFPRPTDHFQLDAHSDAPIAVSASPTRGNFPSSVHDRQASLSKVWSFPAKGTWRTLLRAIMAPSAQSPFSKGFSFDLSDDDELPPFVLPADVGVEVVEEPKKALLEVVIEEDEPEDDVQTILDNDNGLVGEEVDGGIRFTFDIPPQFDSPASTEYVRTPSPHSPVARKPVPYYEPFSEDEDSFSLSRPEFIVPVDEPVKPQTPVRELPAEQVKLVSPSSIPRATSLKRFKTSTKSPAAEVSSSFVTPPSKRGGIRPSFIPQPSASPLGKQHMMTPPTFIPQPQRKSPSPVPKILVNTAEPFSSTTANANIASHDPHRTSKTVAPLKQEHSDCASTSTSWTTPALAARLLTNLIPISSFQWSPRSSSNVAASGATALCMIPTSESSMTMSSSNVEEMEEPISPSTVQQSTPMMLFGEKQVRGYRRRGFVSKEQQLERLRRRMEEERKDRSRDVKFTPPCFIFMHDRVLCPVAIPALKMSGQTGKTESWEFYDSGEAGQVELVAFYTLEHQPSVHNVCFPKDVYEALAIPIYSVIGIAVFGAGWYVTRLARGSNVVWTKANPTPWNTVGQDENLKMLSVNQKFEKRSTSAKDEIGPLKISSLVFGAAAWSHFYNDDSYLASDVPLRTIRLALRYGIRFFDTSPYYGSSEIVLGTALKALELEFPRESYQLMTKCGRYGDSDFDYSPATIRRSVERSLSRLHTTFLDAVYLHDVEFVATPVGPRTEGVHSGALGDEAVLYGLKEGQEGKVWGEGDQKILDAIAELRKMQEEGLVRSIGITGALFSHLHIETMLNFYRRNCLEFVGLPLPTLLRLSLLVLHTPPYRPLDVILSYGQLTLQNTTLISFLPVFLHRARVPQILTASPLSMGLLTPSPPVWHPCPPAMREASAEAVKRCEGWDGGLPAVAIGWAVKAAEGGIGVNGDAKMPTVVGLSNLREVHQAVAVWREVKEGTKEDKRQQYSEEVMRAFEKKGMKDWSW
ncbi:hypothetical protein EW146_g428 [Bondarzewia mesenterica]|uniref:NADP-dependent oxidoreductase domain-containing protein n=1 Tax=Bondarzewia mesenterica TaxID=1095465 RepID=A0A4V6S1L4_9AGAM|nr:hypothetical protein EW146_g428 [Bondarzewia mesenterica]